MLCSGSEQYVQNIPQVAIKAEVPVVNTNLCTTQSLSQLSGSINQERSVKIYANNREGVPQLIGYRVPIKRRVTYHCSVCNKEFVKSDHFRNHLCARTGDDRHLWLIPPKPQVHATHSGERLFICTGIPHRFAVVVIVV